MKYAELRCRTNSSFLQGASYPHELVARAAELGLHALAVTDSNGVYGMPKAYRASKDHPGFKLLVGSELTLRGRPKLTLLAIDRTGYGLMCRMLTALNKNKREAKQVALDWQEFLDLIQRPGNTGLIALPAIARRAETPILPELRELFGPDRVYLPLSRFLDGHDALRTRRALELSRAHDIKIVATNDVHYHVAERRILQDVLTGVRTGTPLSRAGRRLFANAERHLKSAREMHALFSDLPEAAWRTVQIADRCVFSPSELRYRYPSEWIPAGETAQSYLHHQVWAGAARRYPGGVPSNVRAQIAHELGLIHELNFADYFLTIWEIVEFARGRGILCQGRGSAANSVICYCLGITAIDPVRMNLLFERFISVERGEPPDIDVDFENARREEVLQHVYEKYGRDRAAMVAAVITYQHKLAAREVTKVMEREEPEIAEQLIGFPRHLSIHSGGFTLSAEPLIEVVPIEPARMEGRTIVQWDKDDLDYIGLLKVDLLALGMLTALTKCFKLIGRPELNISTVPAEDPATYAMIRRADTIGTFQIESRAQMSMLPRLLPRTFYDLVIQVAIVRPGPIVGKMVHPFLKRRRGLEPVSMPHPELVPILGKTLGIPLFQEQVMKIAITLGGFTPGEADQLRRAIGAWRSKGSIGHWGQKLKDGLLARGLPLEFCDTTFEQLKGFAHYGFPESHSASFALIAYASAWLKCHHPAEFTCSVVNSQPMGFYSKHTLVDDVKRHGVRVLPVHPNESGLDCTIPAARTIQLGWNVVHGLGDEQARELMARRPFTSLADFIARSGLKQNLLEALATGDAFACFGVDQRHALWEILAHAERASAVEPVQQDLFAATLASEARAPRLFERMDSYESIRAEYATFRLSTKGHPMEALRKKFPALPKMTSADARARKTGQWAAVAGLVIVRQRPPTAKGTVFATLEDELGFVDLILHAEVDQKYGAIFRATSFLIASGAMQKDGDAISMIVKKLEPAIGGAVNTDAPVVQTRSWR